MIGAQVQAATYYNRRRRVARALQQKAVPWAHSLTVTKGEYVTHAGHLFRATSSGTTGVTAPKGTNSSDGAVSWSLADARALEQFLFKGVPTP
jgi:hypothetical protein